MSGSRWARLYSGFLELGSGTLAGQLALVAATPVLTRIYTPVDFGTFAIFSAAFGTLAAISCLRMETAITVVDEKSDAKLLHRMCELANALLAVGYLLAGSLCLWAISRVAATPPWSLMVGTVGLGVVLTGAYRIQWAWAIRSSLVREIARTKVRQGTSQVATQLVLGLAGLGPLGLALGSVSGQAAGAFRLARIQKRFPWKRTELRKMIHDQDGAVRRLYQRFRSYPKYSAPAEAISSAALVLPGALLATQFTPVIAGYFLLAMKILGFPMAVIGRAAGELQQVWHARSRRTASGEAFRASLLIMSISAVTMVPVFVLVWLLGARGFAVIFGDQWTNAYFIALILIPVFFFRLLYSTVSTTLAVSERQGRELTLNIAKLTAALAPFALGHLMSLDARVTIGYYSAIMATFYLFATVLMVVSLRHQ